MEELLKIANIPIYNWGIVFLIFLLTEILKGLIKLKGKLRNFYILIPLIFSIIISALIAIIENSIPTIPEKAFSFWLISIVAHDVIFEKIRPVIYKNPKRRSSDD